MHTKMLFFGMFTQYYCEIPYSLKCFS